MEEKIILRFLYENFIIVIFFFLILWMIFIGLVLPEVPERKGWDDELWQICTHAGLYQCNDLQKVYYICIRGMQEFENKNCTYFDNQTQFQRATDSRRRN